MTKTAAKRIEKMARDHGVKDFKWIRPQSIITDYWVRAKCMFGCPSYGKKACCPPEIFSVAECKQFFAGFKSGLFFHFAIKFKDPEMRFPWAQEVNKRILDLEKEVFLSGFYKAFVFVPAPCRICQKCQKTKGECNHPYLARPTLEAFAVDVYATARKLGYPIQVLKSYQEETNRFGLLMVE